MPEIQSIKSHPTGLPINQLMCSEVPGDETIVQFINMLNPFKMPPGTTVTKKGDMMKMQVTNACHITSKGSLARIEVFKRPEDPQPLWDTYLGKKIFNFPFFTSMLSMK